MTITRAFAEYCTGLTCDDVDPDTVDYAKKLVLDTLGTAVGGHHWTDSAETFVGAVRDLRAGAGEGTATLLATGERLSPEEAAFANGALSHSLDYDNRHSRGSLHVGSSVVVAALAAAETADADGETFLAAVVAGYDVAARLGMASNPRSSHERGFHPTGTCGTFGATAAVGVVRGLTADELAAAFGVNGSQASGSYQCSLTGGWNKRIHPGLAARNAFLAVALATNGFEAPEAPIEGELGFLQAYADDPVPERATADLGTVYEVAETKVKPYPLGTFTHAPIAVLVDLVAEEEIAPEDVRAIEVEMPSSGAAFFGRAEGAGHPTTSAGAQFDMPFAAALAVVRGDAGLETFAESVADDYTGEFARLMDVTTTVGSDELEAFLPELYPARVTVETSEGTYERYRERVKGEPEVPMSWDDMERKFTDLAAAFDDETTSAVVDAVRDIESLSARALVAPFRRR